MNHIYTLAEIILKRKKKRKPTFCCFLDIAKAYDTVWRKGLCKKLKDIGINANFIQSIRDIYDNVKSSVLVPDRRTSWFDLNIGLRQGCVLSPLLFLIFINDLIKELKNTTIGVEMGAGVLNNLVFADDVVLLANNKGELQALLSIAEKYARTWNFTFNTKKCKVIVFTKRDAAPEIRLYGECLEVVKEYRYLGVWFDVDLSWKLHKETILAKAKKRAYTMMGFGVCRLLVTGFSIPCCFVLTLL